MSDINAAQSLKNDIVRLTNDQASLKEKNAQAKHDLDTMVERIERLRNEETHIEGELKSLQIAKSDHEAQKLDDSKKLDASHSAVQAQKVEAEKTLEKARQERVAAQDKLSEANAKLISAEAIEARNTEFMASVAVLQRKVEDSEARLKEGVAKLDAQERKVRGLLDMDAVISADNKNESANLESRRELARAEICRGEELKKENERLVAEAEALRSDAQAKLLEAEAKVKAGQLSVDRQFNQLEIEKKRIEVQRLQIDKLIKDNDLQKQLDSLKSVKEST